MDRPTALGFAGVLLASALIVPLQWHAERVKHDAVRTLPAAERVALVERTLRNATALCPQPALASQCTAEVTLLLLLPECDAPCRARARGLLPGATR